LQVGYHLPLGPFDIELTAQINPEFGIRPSIDLDGISGTVVNVTPYANLGAVTTMSVGIPIITKFGIEGDISLIEYDFIMGTSGKLDFVSKDNKVHQLKGKIQEEISHKLLGPNGKVYLFVEYPACVEDEPDGFWEIATHIL